MRKIDSLIKPLGSIAIVKGAVHYMLLIGIVLASAAAVEAHGARSGGSNAGLPIPSISHGEMAVLSGYSSRIVALAQSAGDTNEPFRRVLNYSQIEYAACMWGMMPGSVTDETSPFNECSHAYLAAVKLVLFDMRAMAAEADRANGLISEIDRDMVLNGMAFIVCQFSNEAFNTADYIFPNWLDVPFHGPSVLALLSALMMTFAGAWAGTRALRRSSNQANPALAPR